MIFQFEEIYGQFHPPGACNKYDFVSSDRIESSSYIYICHISYLMFSIKIMIFFFAVWVFDDLKIISKANDICVRRNLWSVPSPGHEINTILFLRIGANHHHIYTYVTYHIICFRSKVWLSVLRLEFFTISGTYQNSLIL